ncbi:MAG: hypothetical protein WAM82_14835 [Thermoanaerobaculia bacterium]
MTDSYTAGEFLKRLAEGALRTLLICEGFAKSVEGSYEAFLFSLGTSCEEWTKIPVEMVEKVEFLGERSCRDHSHPLIRIHFKESPANEPFAAVFSSLLRALNLGPINPQIAPFIGEWMARLSSEAAFFGGESSGEFNRADILERRMCIELRRRCRRGEMKACRLLAEEC